MTSLDGWTGDTTMIRRAFKFPEFLAGIRAVSQIADAAEAANHHPDIDIRWRTIAIGLTTHDAGGVSQFDIELAHQINEIASAEGAS